MSSDAAAMGDAAPPASSHPAPGGGDANAGKKRRTGESTAREETPDNQETNKKQTSASAKAVGNFNEKVLQRQELSREKLYEYIDGTHDMSNILSLSEGWKQLIEMQEAFMKSLEVDYLPYRSGFLGDFNLDDAVGMSRTKAEGAAGGTTAGQTHNTKAKLDAKSKKKQQNNLPHNRKDAYHTMYFNYHLTPANFKENDKEMCWLCSKPLIVNHLTGTPQSEHKPPCFSMALTGVGLAATERGKQINSGNRGGEGKAYPNEEFIEQILKTVTVAGTSTPKTEQTYNYMLYQTWKLLVRSESMAWSHPWCNNKKSQTPFISLRYKTLEGGSASTETVFMYVIEKNSIIEYLNQLAVSDSRQRNEMNYQGSDSLSDVYDPDFFGNPESNRKIWIENALRNIVVGLIPLWCLLNQGYDIYGPVKILCQSLLARQDGKVRTYSKLLNNNPLCSIRIRVKQNCARMVARGAAKKGSLVYRISQSDGEDLDTLTKQLLGNFYGDAEGVALGNVDQSQLTRVASESLQSASQARAAADKKAANRKLRLKTVAEGDDEGDGSSSSSNNGGGGDAAPGTGQGGGKKTKKKRKKRKKRTRRKRKYRKKTRKRRRKKEKTRKH